MNADRKLKRVMIVGGMIKRSPDGDQVKVSINRDAYNEYEYARLLGRTNFDERILRRNQKVIDELRG